MAIAWILDARASETCAVRSVSCPRAFSGVVDVGLDAADVMLVVLVRKSVVVCPSRRAGDHQECPVEGADDLVVKSSTVVLAAV